MSETYLSTRVEGETTILTLDRAPVNALDLELLEAIVERAEQLAAEPPRALVVTGRPGCFSAGLDLKVIPGYDSARRERVVEMLERMVLALYGCPCPVVAALTGHAIAGGFIIGLCADHRIAAAEGRYGLTELKVGVPFPPGVLALVRAELPAAALRQLVLGAETCSAEECLRLGTVDEVRPGEEVLPRALELAARLAALPPELYRDTKAALRRDALAAVDAALVK